MALNLGFCKSVFMKSSILVLSVLFSTDSSRQPSLMVSLTSVLPSPARELTRNGRDMSGSRNGEPIEQMFLTPGSHWEPASDPETFPKISAFTFAVTSADSFLLSFLGVSTVPETCPEIFADMGPLIGPETGADTLPDSLAEAVPATELGFGPWNIILAGPEMVPEILPEIRQIVPISTATIGS